MDKQIEKLIKLEQKRQQDTLQMIPSENYASKAVRQAMGSVFTNKYAEGYPGKRYYQGNIAVDQLETLCQDRAKKLFGVPHVNVQPLSGAPANLATLKALTNPGDIQLSQHLFTGGHLSMGWQVSITGDYRQAVHYHLDSDGEVDWQELEDLAIKHKPKIIWSGGTGYTKIFNWAKYAAIADKVGAYLVADISHIGGLVAGEAHPSPVPYAHVIMTTTHKTLRGPRGAMIMVTDKGLKKDPELPAKIDKSVFPGHQGGPHMNKIAGIAVALKEANTSAFRKYAGQVVKNSKMLGSALIDYGFTLIGGGSENHMIWMDLSNKGIEGWHAHVTLEMVNIYGNKQTIPNDPRPPFYPSGFRIGTPAVTSRGMKEAEMKVIAGFINEGVEIARENSLPDVGNADKDKDQTARRAFKDKVAKSSEVRKLKSKVTAFARKFPVEF